MTRLVPLALIVFALLTFAPGAGAATRSFDGNCDFSGPIIPKPGITIVPSADPHFDLHAKGTCTGHVDGRALALVPLLVDFVDAKTPFDSCALGLDTGIRGTLALKLPSGETLSTPITIQMVRAAVAAPFQLMSDQGGGGMGLAQLMPDSPADAITKCAPGTAGITHATLKGSFDTSSPLVMTVVPAALPDPAAPPLDVRVTIAAKALKDVHASLPIGLTTNAAGAATARLTASSTKLAGGHTAVRAAGTRALTLKLTKAARRKLADSGSLRGRLTVRFSSSAGGVRVLSRTLTLHRVR